jgi:peptidoglycan/xylan/chitin deacetylase (PgdA/CDA1 family)
MIHDKSVKWPNGAKCAVMITYDFDAETLWTSRDPKNKGRPGVLSQGHYGAKVGVPKILEMLSEEEVKATFFVPGWVCENHTSRVEMILKEGHEVGHHSYSHIWVSDDPAAEAEEFELGMEALAKVGVTPKGFRSPAGEVSAGLLETLTRHGLIYDTSLMDDINPYRHTLKDGSKGPIELPWHWSLDDAPYAIFSIASPRPIFTNSHILDIWKTEFREIYRWGGLFDLVLHPQISGRPSRIAMIREMIAYIRQFPDVWIATGAEIAEAWSEAEE